MFLFKFIQCSKERLYSQLWNRNNSVRQLRLCWLSGDIFASLPDRETKKSSKWSWEESTFLLRRRWPFTCTLFKSSSRHPSSRYHPTWWSMTAGDGAGPPAAQLCSTRLQRRLIQLSAGTPTHLQATHPAPDDSASRNNTKHYRNLNKNGLIHAMWLWSLFCWLFVHKLALA